MAEHERRRPFDSRTLDLDDPSLDADTRYAVERSLQDQIDGALSETINGSTDDRIIERPPSVPKTIDDMIKDFWLRKATEFPQIQDPKGDTWIFIDAPSKQPEQDSVDYDRYKRRSLNPHVMQKDILIKLNSPIINKALYDPREQARTLRRRDLLKKLPRQIKYVLDLTPPSEGEEAVWLTASLCCPTGARLWHLSKHIWKISSLMVGGEEEYSTVGLLKPLAGVEAPLPSASTASKSKQEAQPARPNENGQMGKKNNNNDNKKEVSPSIQLMTTPMVVEYNPLRHRTAIERLLATVQGMDPNLDSAPKVWTAFAVSRYLEIVHSPLKDYIVRWLRANPNSYILEVLPEMCLVIADHLQVHDLTRDAFSILVGEEALDSILRARDPELSRSSSIFGRKKEDLPEMMETRKEYATKNFIERINREFDELVSNDMDWIDTLVEIPDLGTLESSTLKEEVQSLRVMLKDYVRGEILAVLRANWEYIPGQKVPPHGGEELVPRVDFTLIWGKLWPEQRIFTRSFWDIWRYYDLFLGNSNFDLPQIGRVRARPMEHLRAPMHSSRWTDFKEVFKTNLEDQIKRCKCAWSNVRDLGKPPSYDESQSVAYSHPQTGIAQGRAIQLPLRRKFSWEQCKSSPTTDATPQAESKSPAETSGDSAGESSECGPSLEAGSLLRNGFHETGQTFKANERTYSYNTPFFFDLKKFFKRAGGYMEAMADRMLGDGERITPEPLSMDVINTLVCLSDNEFKFLPLWAGGNDDGTGGVFNDDLPISQVGFSTPGPGIHTGTSSHASSDFEFLSDNSESHLNTSTATNGGFSDELQHHRVYAADSVMGSSLGDDFSDVAMSELTRAEEEQRAVQQLQEWGLVDMRDQGEANTEARQGEDYSDLFSGSYDSDEDSDDTMTGMNDGDDDEENSDIGA